MILLDTDHLSVLKYPEGPRCARLSARMKASSDPVFGTTIVNAEEQLRGWLAEIAGLRDVTKQVVAYESLHKLLDFLRRFQLVAFDCRATEESFQLRRQKIRIGTMDLKIAAIALVGDMLLLSANMRDYRQVPGLRVENWLEESMGE